MKDSFPVSPKEEHVLKVVIIVFGTKILTNAINQGIKRRNDFIAARCRERYVSNLLYFIINSLIFSEILVLKETSAFFPVGS